MQAMVTQAAQVEATSEAGGALTRAYLRLRGEMLRILASDGLEGLREEFTALFPTIEEPPDHRQQLPKSTSAQLSAAAAYEAQMGLRKLQGWIEGLIHELTYKDRLRVEAEVRAAQAGKPRTGFQP